MLSSINRAALLRASSATIAGLGLFASTMAAVPAQAAVGSPGSLDVGQRNSSTPVLSWSRVAKATGYQVQVDDDPGFGSPEFTTSTANNRSVPTSHLRPGTAHWRVRATIGRTASAWHGGQFQVGPVDVPVPTHPADHASLPQPQSAPLLRWSASRGATSYVVTVDGDSDFIGAKSYTTQTTSLVLPDPLAAGDYYWRVTANKGKGLTSLSSHAATFFIQPLALPSLTYPADTFEQSVEDVVFDWKPVPGARAYDLEVALDPDFLDSSLRVEGIRGTRYSPPTTLNNDEFWWRVRAVDLGGQPTAWTPARSNFKRQWPDKPVAVHPVGTAATPGQQTSESNYFEWTPAQHATYYELELARDRNFTTGLKTCTASGTTYVPGPSKSCQIPEGSVYYWRVRPIDQPYPKDGGLAGAFSEPQAAIRTSTDLGAFDGTFDVVEDLKVAHTGTGLRTPGKGCVSTASTNSGNTYTRPTVCERMSTTPVFSWTAQPGVTSYIVWFAQDENFTTTKVQPITTTNTMLSLGRGDLLSESQSGRPYYWYVQPCTASGCGQRPDSQFPGLPGAAAFQKVSPPVTGLESSDEPQGVSCGAKGSCENDITFSWDDYLDTNLATLQHGEVGHQAAEKYRIEIDDDPGFADPIDTATIDQTTYTAADTLYPEGTIHWRVQAIDDDGNPLAWSAPASLVKSSPPVALQAPLGGVAVSGTTPFQWTPQSFANRYTLEVYRNNDTTYSPANRLFSATVRNPSYAWDTPVPASSTPYVWRVRRIDASGNFGPWSAPGHFVSLGAAPEPLSPTGGWQLGNGVLFEWSDVPGAVSYLINLREGGGESQSFKTVATAYAPSTIASGSFTWSVTAIDSDGKPLGTSTGRSFLIDATAPQVTKVRPGKLKPKSTIKVSFSERVTGLHKRSVKLNFQRNGKGKLRNVKVTVKSSMGGRQVLLNPKGRLKAGTYRVVLKSARIKDMAGNSLTSKEIRTALGR